jgi:hypothetical protein
MLQIDTPHIVPAAPKLDGQHLPKRAGNTGYQNLCHFLPDLTVSGHRART